MNRLDAIRLQRRLNRRQDGNTAADGRFESDRDALLARLLEELFPAFRYKRLIRRHDVLAFVERHKDEIARHRRAADKLHDDRNLRIVHDLRHVVRQHPRRKSQTAIIRRVPVANLDKLDLFSDRALNHLLFSREDFRNPRPDRT